MKFQVYGVIDENEWKWKISANIAVDLAYWHQRNIQELFICSPNLSIGHAVSLLQCLQNTKHRKQNRKDHLFACQRKNDLAALFFPQPTKSGFSSFLLPYQAWKEAVFPVFQGKLLLLDEVLPYLQQHKRFKAYTDEEQSMLIQVGYLLHDIFVTSGVSYPKQGSETKQPLVCHRCGSVDKVVIRECSICGEPCATCENCIQMGRSKTCTPLLSFSAKDQKELGSFSLSASSRSFQLTPYQQKIAEDTQQFLSDDHRKELLIWAVTGAGKTEMVFPAIFLSLQQGKRVLLASPRKDVIIELTPRLKNAFPEVPIVSLYGGSPQKWDHGLLYLATTHQVLRFTDYFDLVIIDEMDAFPFHQDPMLQYAVSRARKNDGKTILMTATPPEKRLKAMGRKQRDLLILPIRYHRHPLPIPIIKVIPKKVKLLYRASPHPSIQRFIDHVLTVNGQAFIFVAGVKEVRDWKEAFGKWFPDIKLEGIHANDPNREQKTAGFREGEIQFLVTTTIMERGVTIPNLHVLVLGAEAKIFDEAALVQIAGRVGRTASFPGGKVCFLTEGLTKEIVKAKKQIKKMNRLAAKLLAKDGE